MRIVAAILGVLLILLVLQDAFETIVLPRRVSRRFRLASIYYAATWGMWAAIARKMRPGNRREYYLGYYGPLSLIFLLAIWAALCVVGFAMLNWGLRLPLNSAGDAPFGTYVYMSGTTFITLGLGDVLPF